MEEGDRERYLGSDPLGQLEGEEQGGGAIGSGRGGIVTARGTADGLVIRLDGRVDQEGLQEALLEFLEARRAFLSGHEVSLEWVGSKPREELVAGLSKTLLDKFGITVKSSRLRDQSLQHSVQTEDKQPRESSAKRHASAPKYSPSAEQPAARSMSLFDGMEGLNEGRDPVISSAKAAGMSASQTFWDDPDARIIYSTLRSGQKIETDHSLVIMGDVNSGAEIVAGGDIIVLGTLRGVAHAGAYDETGGGRVIFALNLQATQLRIGMVISRGSSENQRLPEIARVEGGLIVVEAYTGKSLATRRRE
ncbi:MAG: septum site-determining protein MinC [Deltaproteobacteria bacterium]|nr:septum site-determining protein MinC [Deltaproteobacteria bacterium]